MSLSTWNALVNVRPKFTHVQNNTHESRTTLLLCGLTRTEGAPESSKVLVLQRSQSVQLWQRQGIFSPNIIYFQSFPVSSYIRTFRFNFLLNSGLIKLLPLKLLCKQILSIYFFLIIGIPIKSSSLSHLMSRHHVIWPDSDSYTLANNVIPDISTERGFTLTVYFMLMSCNNAECCIISFTRFFFFLVRKSQHSKQRKHPLYSSKHNVATVVFHVCTMKDYNKWRGGFA